MARKFITYRDDQGKRIKITYTEASVFLATELLVAVRDQNMQAHEEIISRWIARGMNLKDVLQSVTSLLDGYGVESMKHTTTCTAIHPITTESADMFANLKAPKPVKVSFVRKVIANVRFTNRKRKQSEKITVIDGVLRGRKAGAL